MIQKSNILGISCYLVFLLASRCSRKLAADRNGSGRSEEVGHQLYPTSFL